VVCNLAKELELPDTNVLEDLAEPSAEIVSLLETELTRLFILEDRINLGTEKKNREKAHKLIAKSLTKWGERSPKGIRSKLIACISALGPRENRVGKVGAEKIVDEALSRVAPLCDIQETAITNLEKKFIDERVKKYLNDYEFNESSDISLLRQLVSAEYIAARLEFAQRQDWKHPQKYSPALQNIENRMMKLMERLGIARFQRDDELDLSQSNIAELALSLDVKKQKAREFENKDQKEYDMFVDLREKQGRHEVNVVPDSEYDSLEKKMENEDEIDPNKFFDIEEMDIEDLERLLDDTSIGDSKNDSKMAV